MSGLFDVIESQKSDKSSEYNHETIKRFIQLIEGFTEFNDSELKAISLIQTDKYIEDLLVYYIQNKKHVKRKFAREVIEAFKAYLSTQTPESSENIKGGWFKR